MTCPPYTEAATLDMVQAYRNSPIILEHKKYLAVCWQDKIYIQHNTVEGLSSAGSIQGTPTNACIEILCANDIGPMFKWVDDFVIFRSPSDHHATLTDCSYDYDTNHTYAYDLTCMMQITDPLSIPWHPISKKGQDFGLSFKYLSFLWNLADCSVSLPKEKQRKLVLKINLFISKPCVSRKDCASLHRSLQHVSFIYCDTRNTLPSLTAFLSK